jgi:hypothetical protein
MKNVRSEGDRGERGSHGKLREEKGGGKKELRLTERQKKSKRKKTY